MTENNKSKRVVLGKKLHEIYKSQGELETSCCRQCGCCRVACPQMKYSEALQVINKIWNEWSKEDKIDLLVMCVRYFFSKSLIKPCPMLSGTECRVYEDRPLNCRLYGLWPNDAWERRVSRLAEKLKLPESQIPLNKQCPLVRMKNGQNPLTEEQIQSMFDALDNLDKQILSSGRKEGTALRKAENMVRNNWNYRTIHDWILFFFWGEEKLAQMTDIAMLANNEQLEGLMDSFESIVRSSDFSLPKQVTPGE
jgi:Fe-S-cluster containining protein